MSLGALDVPAVSIVIPSYNGRPLVEACLASLARPSRRAVEVLVVDNGSSDGTEALVAGWPGPGRCLRLPSNQGFAGACNAGAAAARGRWLVFLNNDAVAADDWLDRLVEAAEQHPSWGVCASKARLLSNPQRLDSVGSFLTWSGFLRHEGLAVADHGQYDAVGPLFSPKGVAFIMSRRLFEEVGGFDERYFAYFEETDLFWRVWLTGHEIHWVPEAIVHHRVGATSGRLRDAFIDYHNFKNRLCTLLKNAGASWLLRMLPIHLACCAGLITLNGVWPPRWGSSAAIARAMGWNLRHLGETLRRRRTIQAARRVSDQALAPYLMRPVAWREFARYTRWMVFQRQARRTAVQGTA